MRTVDGNIRQKAATQMQSNHGASQSHAQLRHVSATPQMSKAESSKTMGVPGYYVAKVGLPNRAPNYTFTKDSNTFFSHVTRHTRGKPAPGAYDQKLSWKTANGAFGSGPERKTFTDDAAKHSKQVPSPSKYNPERKRRLLLGQMR